VLAQLLMIPAHVITMPVVDAKKLM